MVVALCGGNIDTTVLGRCLERGLAADDRLCRFVVHVSDRPGDLTAESFSDGYLGNKHYMYIHNILSSSG